MIVLRLAFLSLLNRKSVAALTVFAIMVSVTLFLSVDKIRSGARDGFANTISGTDVIAGARTGPLQLLLYSVFHIGNATNNITWKSFEYIQNRPETAWAVPLSLGDSHKGFRVLGTTGAYFDKFRYGRDRALTLSQGRTFDGVLDVVVGAEVARSLNYQLGQKIVIAHGLGKVSFANHDNMPFEVVGILEPTGTPVDQTLHVPLEGIEAIHVGWGARASPGQKNITPEDLHSVDLHPKAITAALVGLKSKMKVFRFQRAINDYNREPLMAILPGVALQDLWRLMGAAEQALIAISALVIVAGLLGMLTMLLSGLNERRREMAILRSVGAKPTHIVALFVTEAFLLALAGSCLGVVLAFGGLGLTAPWIEAQYGLYLTIAPPGPREALLVMVVSFAGALVGLWPALRAYRLSVADGLIVRI
ncbi:FtsX-like permease family protein [Magnetovibrio sp. PR-2]|uniref:ABC transporter permease n=1 Tax=Magnetovibrio sp. PR-2 TaxID=3120356 RepID=UPI002FCDE2AD